MPNYKCFRCKKHESPMKSYMYVHLCKNIKCPIDPTIIKNNEDEQIKFSLIPEENWPYIKFNNNFNCVKTPIEFIDELKEIYNTKRKKCNHCNLTFTKYKELENHLFQCVNISSVEKNTKINNKLINNTQNINNDNININLINDYNIIQNNNIIENNDVIQNNENYLDKIFKKYNSVNLIDNIYGNTCFFISSNEEILKLNNNPKIMEINDDKGFIYLIILREFLNNKQNIYKIGKSRQNNNKRLQSYPKGSIALFQVLFNNCSLAENILKIIFKNIFIQETQYGTELFRGDYKLMIKYIYALSEMNLCELF